MKILFITDNFPPEVNAPASRTYEHCRIWTKNGAEVTVITCAPNFPQGRLHDGYRNRLYQSEIMEGIRVIRVWSYITANAGFAKRVLDYVSFAFTAFVAGLFVKADVIVATSPQFFTTFAGRALSTLKRRPWIFELRDLWPESLVAVGVTKNSRLINMLERMELSLYRHADKVIAVTPAFKENLVTRGIAPEKIDIITNGVDLERFRRQEQDGGLKASLGLQGKFIFSYIGTHGMAHGLDFVVEAASKMNEPLCHFLFIGDGAEKKSVIERARACNLTNITFLDPVPKDEVIRYLSISDAALVPLRRSETFKSVIPSKIFEAAALGKPILLGVDGLARDIVEQYPAGLFFEPENETDFLQKARAMIADKTLYARLSNGCISLAQDYDRDALGQRMFELVKELYATNGLGSHA